jgi:hypothetical protein
LRKILLFRNHFRYYFKNEFTVIQKVLCWKLLINDDRWPHWTGDCYVELKYIVKCTGRARMWPFWTGDRYNRFDYKQQRYREDASNYSKNVTKYLIFFCSDKSHHFGKDCENLYTVNSLLLATVVHNPHPLCSQILGRKNLVRIYNLHQLLTCSCGGQMRKWGLKFVKKNV